MGGNKSKYKEKRKKEEEDRQKKLEKRIADRSRRELRREFSTPTSSKGTGVVSTITQGPSTFTNNRSSSYTDIRSGYIDYSASRDPQLRKPSSTGTGVVSTITQGPSTFTNNRSSSYTDIRSGYIDHSASRDPQLRKPSGTAPSNEPRKTTVVLSAKSSALLCVAIDFGTTYSGYGYSFRNNPDKVYVNHWDGVNIKTATVLLLTPNQQFDSFGYDARRKYENLMKDGSHKRWYLFQRFKMKLFVKEKPLLKDMKIHDFTGKSMPAIKIFSLAIKYMKDHLIEVLNKRPDKVQINENRDIHWVLTVPAVWNDLSKVFMRQAAIDTGIPSAMLTLALEPEAASLYCQRSLSVPVGCRYMVLDLGGGTADITCHEVNAEGTLKELHQPTGGDFGGTTVDNAFVKLLNGIFGADVIRAFKQDYAIEYWELMSDFEMKKRRYDGRGKMIMKFPVILVELYEEQIGQSVMETIEDNSIYRSMVDFKQGKVFIDETLGRTIFDSAVSQIRDAVIKLNARVDNIQHILLVGGFSESPYLQRVMQACFGKLIEIPKEPASAVVNGAVKYGHETKAISSRVCKFTYGIARMMKFKDGQHYGRKKITMSDGMVMCDDIFNKHIEIGQSVSTDTANAVVAQEYYPSIAFMTQAVLEVYASSHRNPAFIDDRGCQFVGLIKVDIDPKGDKFSKILVKLIFGGTELLIEVKEVKTNKITLAAVDFLG